LNIVNGNATKSQGFVYADGGLLAKQFKGGTTEKVVWAHANPATGSAWHTDETGALVGREELDPLGADVSVVDPYTSLTGGGDGTGDCEGAHVHVQRPAMNDVDGSCYLDGVAAPCGMIADMANHGSGSWVDLTKTDALGRPLQQPKKDPAPTPDYDDPTRPPDPPPGAAPRNPMQLALAAHLSYDVSTASTNGGGDDVWKPIVWPKDESAYGHISVFSAIYSGSAYPLLTGGNVPLPDNLRDRVSTRVNNPKSDCAEFYGKIIAALEQFAGKAHSLNAIDNFDRIQGGAGFRLDPKQNEKGTSNFLGGKRVAYIKPTASSDERSDENVKSNYAGTALGETFHHAKENGLYTDRDLAKALFSLLSPNDQKLHPLPGSNDTVANSGYFHPLVLTAHCPAP
jgi:hypothetical protein